jgi:hypothetical protein
MVIPSFGETFALPLPLDMTESMGATSYTVLSLDSIFCRYVKSSSESFVNK